MSRFSGSFDILMRLLGCAPLNPTYELLRKKELEEAYRQASNEVDSAWDAVVGDGLTDETW